MKNININVLTGEVTESAYTAEDLEQIAVRQQEEVLQREAIAKRKADSEKAFADAVAAAVAAVKP